MKHTIGIALSSIDNGSTGPVAIEGVFIVPKVSEAVFAAGEALLWDASAGQFDDAASVAAAGDIRGAVIAVAAGLNGQTTCVVRLSPGNTELT